MTNGTVGPHRHLWNTDEGRTLRICRRCAAIQVKVSGRWHRRDDDMTPAEAERLALETELLIETVETVEERERLYREADRLWSIARPLNTTEATE